MNRFKKLLTMGLYRRLKMAKRTNRVVEALLESSSDLHRLGIMDDDAYRKITLRHLGPQAISSAQPISAEEIRNLREQENISQGVFARYLNLTVGFVSQLERGTKQPKGPALVLLNLIRNKGLQAIL
jgi:putative transcriptional regulator